MDEDIKVSQPDRPYTMLNPAIGTLDDFPPPPPRMPTRLIIIFTSATLYIHPLDKMSFLDEIFT